MVDYSLRERASRWDPLLIWWHSWLGRCALHLPWLLCALAYVKFLNTAQGQTALEFPVARPLLAVFVVGCFIGACSWLAKLIAEGYTSALLRPRVVEFRTAIRSLFALDSKNLSGRAETLNVSQPSGGRFGGLACSIILCIVMGSGVQSVANVSGWHLAVPLPILLLGVLAGTLIVICVMGIALVPWLFARHFLKIPVSEEWGALMLMGSPAAFAVSMYAAGMYVVTHRLDDAVSLGSHALVATGFLLTAFFFLAIVLLLLARATLRVGWALIALGLALYFFQSPLAERPNPLLTHVPELRQGAGECAKLSAMRSADVFRPAQAAAQAEPSILVSAEGGGIRAAYWTAVSLEELSQAHTVPLLSRVDILSGVSGGSLGVATFLAAQELPVEARLPCIREYLSGDFLSPLIAGLLFLDFPGLLVPTSLIDRNRGDYFEEFIAKRWLTLTGSDFFYRPMKQALEGEQFPKVYFNTTDAFSGEYVALTNATRNVEIPLTRLNTTILDRLPDLRIAQAVHMSARFPYLSPSPDIRLDASKVSNVLFGQTASAETWKGNASLASLVDGGYFDNSGLWPAQRLLDGDRRLPAKPERLILHIVNDQSRACEDASTNTGCIRAMSDLLRGRLDDRGGWLLRPTQAIQAVRSAHALQSVKALELAQSQNNDGFHQWNVPMPPLREPPFWAGWLLDLSQWLPIHGRDSRIEAVALGWTLAPKERELLSAKAEEIGRVLTIKTEP